MAKNKNPKAKSKSSVKSSVKPAKSAKVSSKSAAKPAKPKAILKSNGKAPVKAKKAMPSKEAPKAAKKIAAPKKIEVPKNPKLKDLPPKTLAKTVAKTLTKAPIAEKPAAPVKLDAKSEKIKQRAHQVIREALTEAAMAALPEKEVILTNADGLRYCKVADCDELATSDSYCRFHYLLNWKKIQLRKKILAGDKLDRYIEELTARYPDKYLEMIRKDLANEKDFLTAIQELEIDDSGDDSEFEDDARTYIDEVRGVTTGTEDEEF